MPYGRDNLTIMYEKILHPLTTNQNPACRRCGWRTYPHWGPHDCLTPPDETRMRHLAGSLLAHMSFWREPPELQTYTLCRAIAFMIAANVPDSERAQMKWQKLADEITALIPKLRTTPAKTVQDVSKSVLRVKKGKKVKRVSMSKVPRKKRMHR